MIKIPSLPDTDIIQRYTPRNEVSGSKEDLEPDAVILIEDDILGRCALVEKLTTYVQNPADLMFVLLDSDASQLTELSITEYSRYITILGTVSDCYQMQFAGSPVIAFNQQKHCRELPHKFLEDGTEVKVQTINNLHAHVFIEDFTGNKMCKLKDLEQEDIYDFYDPLEEVANEIIGQEIQSNLTGLKISIVTDTFPLGLTLEINMALCKDLPSLEITEYMQYVQNLYFNLYGEIEGFFSEHIMRKSKRERLQSFFHLTQKYNLSPSSERAIKSICMCLKDNYSLESRKYLRLVKGPALTWIIYEKDGRTHITFSPKFFSRGNAMETLGVWVEQEKEVNYIRNKQKKEFYRRLVEDLSCFLPCVKLKNDLN